MPNYIEIPNMSHTDQSDVVCATNPLPVTIAQSDDGTPGEFVSPGDTYSNVAGDFTATPTVGAKTIAITGISFTPLATNIASVIKITSAGVASVVPLTSVVISGTYTLTLADADNFATGDIVRVSIYGPARSYDATQDVQKTLMQNPVWGRYTDSESYTSLVATDATTYVEGAVIDVRGYNVLNLYYSKTLSSADNNYLRVIYLVASDGAVDYQETYIGSPTGGVTAVAENVYNIDKAAEVHMLSLPTNGAPYMRIDTIKVTDTGTDSTFTTFINKAYI
jgi:hypothetical protein